MIYFEKKNDYSFNKWDIAGEYEADDERTYTLLSISINSSPVGNNVGDFEISFPEFCIEDCGEIYRDSDKFFTLVSDDYDGSTTYIYVVDETPGKIVLHYTYGETECDFYMYESYPMP